MSTPVPVDADEVTTLRAFLDQFRDTLRRQCSGIGADGLAWTLQPSTMTLGGMLKHLAYVEHWWFSQVLHGHEASGIWADVDWRADEDWDWHSAVHDSPDQLRTWLDEEIAAADARIEEALARGEGLEVRAVRERHGSAPTLRWILVHMVEEYARHCGHADLIRESIDGRTGL